MLAWMAFECPLGMHSTNVIGSIYVFLVVNDLLDDNGCLVLLQSFDDAFAMELFSFTWGSQVYWPENIHASTTSLCILSQER